MQIIAIIPARGGSKGILCKNLKPLGKIPLLVHSILDAKEAEFVDEVYVSTDNLEISQVSKSYGAKVIDRPIELANDNASSESALIHALDELEKSDIFPSIIVFLQCTSPIRTGKEIDQAISQLQSEKADSLLSVSISHKFLWKKVNGAAKAINYDYRQRPRRQDMELQFVENGSIYIFKPWVLKELGNRLGGKISLFTMSETASWEIDSITDFEIVESLLTQQKIQRHAY